MEAAGEHTEGIVDADGPGHALLTLNGWEHLSGVLESYRSFSERVRDCEKVDEPGLRQQSSIHDFSLLADLTRQ